MGQLGFFDLSQRYDGLDKKKDPLVLLASVAPWETFRAKLEAAVAQQGRKAAAERKSAAGRKPWDEVDRRHKLVRRYTVTDAARHDSQELDALLDDANTCGEVWADSAYRSAEIETSLAKRGYKSRIHRRAARNRVLSKREQQGNTTRSQCAPGSSMSLAIRPQPWGGKAGAHDRPDAGKDEDRHAEPDL